MEPPGPWRTRRPARVSTVLAALAGAGALLLLGLAPVAAWSATHLPQPLPAAAPDLPTGALAATSGIRPVPVGLPAGSRVASVAEVRASAVDAVGAPAADRLLALLAGAGGAGPEPVELGGYDYPYRYPMVDAALKGVPRERIEQHGAPLAAALVLLAAQPTVDADAAGNAARLAFAVLDRARAGGACDPQLDLLALLASDPQVPDEVLAAERGRTERACPGDPTPGWLATSRALHLEFDDPEQYVFGGTDGERLAAAASSAADLVDRFPTDPGVLALLGDVHLATARHLSVFSPFTARREYQEAATVFERLRSARDDPGASLGLARAELGLGHPDRAARLTARAADAAARPALALQVAIRAEERSRRFDRARDLARGFAERGPDAYPDGSALVPLQAPLSAGYDRLTPFTASLGLPVLPQTGEGSVVSDLGFVPSFHPVDGLTGDAPDCPEFLWRRAALLSGAPGAAAVDWPTEFLPSDAAGLGACPDAGALREQVDLARAGTLPPLDPDADDPEAIAADIDRLADARQNLLRWAGDLDAARAEAVRWAVHLGESSALAAQRLGEIDYLRGNHGAAATEFAAAALRHSAHGPAAELAAAQSVLGQGAALLAAGRGDDAVALLRPLALDAARGFGRQVADGADPDSQQAWALVSYYASTLLGDHALATGQDAAALQDLRTALLWSDTLTGVVHLDAARNSAAVAAVGAGDTDAAVPLSRAAVDADPHSPVYLMTSAVVARRAGDAENAVQQNRAALAADPSAYPAANNLGVLLARRGDLSEASTMLRAAVAANPDYALAWHNLGVVEGRRGPLHVPRSQGALARAVALQPALADAPQETELDTGLYRTGLDVSKPLPAGWSFAGSQRQAPVLTAGLLAVLLAGVGVLALRDNAPTSAARDWLDGVATRLARTRGGRRLRHPAWAVLATVGAFLLAFWRQPLWPWTGLTYALGLVVLVGTGMAVRGVLARRQVSGVVHGTWAPGVLVGLVTGAFGAPVAPLPVVRAPARSARVALAAPLVLAGLCLVLLLEAVVLHTPLASSFCVAAFVMAGSLLLPVSPLDGSRAGAAGVVGAAGLLGGLLLLGLGLN